MTSLRAAAETFPSCWTTDLHFQSNNHQKLVVLSQCIGDLLAIQASDLGMNLSSGVFAFRQLNKDIDINILHQ